MYRGTDPSYFQKKKKPDYMTGDLIEVQALGYRGGNPNRMLIDGKEYVSEVDKLGHTISPMERYHNERAEDNMKGIPALLAGRRHG